MYPLDMYQEVVLPAQMMLLSMCAVDAVNGRLSERCA